MDTVIAFYSDHEVQLLALAQNALLTVLIIIAAGVGAKVLKGMVYKGAFRLSKHDDIVSKLLAALASYVVYLIATVIILDLFGVNTASLVALVGAAGLAIGLALKDTLSNVAAGVMLLFLKPLKKQEFVEISGFSGSVTELSLFTTVLETADGLFISMPNSTVWASTIKNFSRNSKRRMDITVGISYGDSIEAGLTALCELVADEPRLLEMPAPQYLVHTLADSSVNLQLRAWANTAEYWEIYWKLQRNVKEKIESKGLTIPFPQRDLHIIKEKAANEE